MSKLNLTKAQHCEFVNIAIQSFAPLTGFMTEEEFNAVVESMFLPSGKIFPLPVYLDVSDDFAKGISIGDSIELFFHETHVGNITVSSIYKPNKELAAKQVFLTSSTDHPGAKHLLNAEDTFIGGDIEVLKLVPSYENYGLELTPKEAKAYFKKMGWKTITGFQTRNVPHRAHEYLQRVAMEVSDGIFIHPLIGAKKVGDYTPEAVMKGYQALINNYYPEDRAVLSFLTTNMRYAGPREALFHALIRRNYGCTHFIVGRDHAGVSDYYGLYDSQNMAVKYEKELGIKIMNLQGPYLCPICDSIVSQKTCRHFEQLEPEQRDISGTQVRNMISTGDEMNFKIFRKEIFDSLKGIKLFIKETDEDAC